MQSKKTFKSPTEVVLTLSAKGDYLQTIKEVVLQRLSRAVRLPGFREGKAPPALVEKNVDQSQLQTEFLDEILNRMYRQALDEHNLRPVSNPAVSLKKFVPFSEVEFEAQLEVVGEISLPDYRKIRKAKVSVKITAKDVDEVIAALRQRAAERQEVKRAAKDGDEVIIDFKGVDSKGEPVKGADGQDYPLLLGSNNFIPGFEKNLLGLKPGEQKTFTLAFPKDYGVRALAGTKVEFTVTVKKIQELHEPAADDAFAAKAGPFKSLQELKDDVRKQLTLEKQQEADRAFENDLIQDIASKTKLVVPKTLVDQQIERAEQEERRNLAYRGQTWQEHLAEEGVSEEEHRERNRSQAEERVKAGLILAEIADKEKIQLAPGELQTQITLLKGQYKDAAMQAELDKPQNQEDIAARMLTEKTVNKLVNYATQVHR